MKSDQKITIEELSESPSVWIELTDEESKKTIGGFQGLVEVLTTAEIQLSHKWAGTRLGDIEFSITITNEYSH